MIEHCGCVVSWFVGELRQLTYELQGVVTFGNLTQLSTFLWAKKRWLLDFRCQFSDPRVINRRYARVQNH